MKKKAFMIVLLASLSWIAASCNSNPAKAELVEAEKTWTGENISSYQIEVLVVESIWHAQSHTIIVQENAVIESSARCIPAPTELGTCEVEAFSAEKYTVPGLFVQAQSQLESQYAQWLKITYDPIFGFPHQISFDNPDMIDEDWSWRVTAFEILK